LKGRQLVALAATALLGTALFWIYARAVHDGVEWKRASDLAVVAPDFEEADPDRAKQVGDFALADRHGNVVRLSQFAQADVVLINIWSSNCPACDEEIPALSEMDRRLLTVGRIVLITITVDQGWSDVARYFPQGTDLRVLFDPDQKVTKGIFGTTRYPETFLLDKERRIRARFDGKREWHSPEMLDYLADFV
jgi:peroxiredoxin